MRSSGWYIILLSIFIWGCDPGYYGDVFIDNQTQQSFELHYQTRYKDTTIFISGAQKVSVLRFGGLGDGSAYDHCLNEFSEVSLVPVDPMTKLLKPITDMEQWEIKNENKGRLSNKKIICTFMILPADIE